ncbi:tetratricopeptide repeat protein [Marispirochaeta sp.]|jgi:tetratricopeptide (TPR) repeat protein|uniref:tetratricopeptide repeat protein n=1 Tax=Marispirochaeta sp. TaxID=2038653 RepID=UPI0029C72DA4|nr:tetratricopeptide repeat protein [Marispirochaeta sp.]
MTRLNIFSRVVLVLLFLLTAVTATAQEQPDALAMYRQGEYAKAVDICLAELETSPRNMNSYTVLGWSLIALRRYQEALDYAQQGLEISRYDHRVVEIAGEANFYLGNNVEALQFFEEYTVLAPTGDRIGIVYYFMGETFIRIGEYNHADIALSTAVYHSPNIARWWARLGYAREMAEDFKFAMEAYDQALKLNPSLSDALRGKERAATKMNS